jgi:beta-galactosidase
MVLTCCTGHKDSEGVSVEYRDGYGIAVNYSDKPYKLNILKQEKIVIGEMYIPTVGVTVWKIN